MFLFLTQALRHNRETGAVLPSSRSLAQEMTRSLREAVRRKRVLEVGPGTGAVTRPILDSLCPGDEFHLVELNRSFSEALERRLLAPFRTRLPGVAAVLHQGAVEAVDLPGRFDFIVCSLPFSNFEARQVQAIFRRLLSLLSPTGELVYFEYLGPQAFQMSVAGRSGRQRLRRIRAHKRWLARRYQGSRRFVALNILPAFVVRLRSAPGPAAPEAQAA